MKSSQIRKRFLLFVILTLSTVSFGQTTEFKFSGDTGTAYSGALDMEFRVYNASVDGSQIGSTIFRSTVAVDNGLFSVNLDYGVTAFPVADRWIEVRTSPVGAGVYTIVNPRAKVISTPRAILANNAVNADMLGGLGPSQWVLTTDPRLSDFRNPLAGSTNYVQNATSQQVGASFNVGGSGTVGGTFSASTVNATSQFNLASTRILYAQSGNTFGGWFSGTSNTGWSNTGFGYGAARINAGGANNAMFGHAAGYNNVSGSENAMFGSMAGYANTANFNSYFGSGAGRGTTSGERNAFIGYDSGYQNTTGLQNTMVGASSGTANVTGSYNTFVGNGAGYSNTSGSNNTALGRSTNVGSNLTYATAIGSGAFVSTSNTVVIGRPSDRVETAGIHKVGSLGAAGTNHVCRNTNLELSTCSSSIRYKSDVIPFGRGLELVRRLNPVAFTWKSDGSRDMGLVAEEVNKAEPLLATLNDRGEVEGVKYDRVAVVLLNAVREQQAQIESQRKQILQQQKTIDDMRILVCRTNRRAAVCLRRQ